MDGHRMESVADVRAFVLAGNARLTLVSTRTGERFTYRVRQKDETSPHFVGLLTGSDNESSYTFMATIFKGRELKHGMRSSIADDAPGATAFRWFWKHLWEQGRLHHQLEVWHEGRCGRCGRPLTVPESIENGLGPDCIKRMSRERSES